MKILYLISHNPYVDDGITKKIHSQTKTWRNFGHIVAVYNIFIEEKIPQKLNVLNAKIFKRDKYYKMPNKLFEDIKEYNPDVIYFRYEPYKPFLNKIFKLFVTIVELNTINIAEQKSTAKMNLFNYFRYLYNKYTYKIAFKYIDGIIGVTQEIINSHSVSKLNISKVAVPNSIVLSGYKIVKIANQHRDKPNLFFMGSKKYLWHGVDKILQLASQTQDELFFHIVGVDNDGNVELPNVCFHGFQPKEVYIKILQRCHVCIGTLGMHRISMDYGSTLKTLEYLAYGFPIIIGYKEFAFMNLKDKDFIMELDNQEDNVQNNVHKIIEFCYSNLNRIVQHNEVFKFIDSQTVERSRIRFLNRIRTTNVKN